mmetsp:Transcript_64089/g.101686  ORF Transcript_64089/g.101686 Transcript_64089/m.101686 type:complete len:164 (-) Transcript_64089:138-629(-)
MAQIVMKGLNPWGEHVIGQIGLRKERDYYYSTLRWKPDWREQRDDSHYRIPAYGEQVQVRNMNRRPHLTGSRAEILSKGVDEEGFCEVRILEGNPNTRRKMKIKLDRLMPFEDLTSRPLSVPASLSREAGFKRPRALSVTSGRSCGSCYTASIRSIERCATVP